MDAFAVSISLGTSLKDNLIKDSIVIALSFAIFQALMPAAGYFSAGEFYNYISHIDHWVASFMLAAIGGKMIYESLSGGEECPYRPPYLTFKMVLVLSVATSIDALAAGISLQFTKSPILIPAITIGVITLILSGLGIIFGKRLGCLFGRHMETVGGVVLILLGLKIIAGEYLPSLA
jgi:manganese efflux pump family protein